MRAEVHYVPGDALPLLERLEWHETFLLAIGWVAGVAGLWRAGGHFAPPVGMLVATAGFALAAGALSVRPTPGTRRLRVVLTYVYLIGFYASMVWLAPALGMPRADAALLAADEALFGLTPSVLTLGESPPLVLDFFAIGYLGYEAYVIGSVLVALRRPPEGERRYHDALVATFVVGFVGYLLVPALGPRFAFPEFYDPAPVGGAGFAFTSWIVEVGSSRFDVFPSLHVAVTLVLLSDDFRRRRRVFWALLPGGCVMMLATVWLGYHYVVDVIAGCALASVVILAAGRRERRRRAGS